MKVKKRISAGTREQLSHELMTASKDGYVPVGEVKIYEHVRGYWDKWGNNHDQSSWYYYIYCEKDVEL